MTVIRQGVPMAIPSLHVFTSCRVIASCCTRFVSSFVRSFVWLVGCCIVSLPLVVACPVSSRCHATSLHCISSLFIPLVSSLSRRRVVASRLASPRPSPLIAQCGRRRARCSSSTAWWDWPHGSMFVRWRVWVHMFWFGDCKRMRKFPFGDVPQNSFKIWEKIMIKNNKRSLVTCLKAIFPISIWWRAWVQMFLFSDCKKNP